MKRINIGTVSHGTLRGEDLIDSFMSELKSQKPLHRPHRKLLREAQEFIDSSLDPESWDLIDELMDALNDYAPEGFYFGAHPGDGSDFGFWLSEWFVEDFDGLKVSDLAEIPKGYTGDILQVNDHGNISLYCSTRGRLRSVWSIV